MARGYPDWGIYAPTQAGAPTVDVGEMAARLGSPVTFDRRGNVFWVDSFESGAQTWTQTLSGTGAEIYLSDARARTGFLSCAMRAGSTLLHSAQLQRWFALPATTRVGLECSVVFSTQVAEFTLSLYYVEASVAYRAAIRVRPAAGAADYLNSASMWIQFAVQTGVDFHTAMVHTLKVVIDIQSKIYQRVIFDQDQTNLALDLLAGGAVGSPRGAEARILLDGNAGQNGLVYLDDVILTVNEP